MELFKSKNHNVYQHRSIVKTRNFLCEPHERLGLFCNVILPCATFCVNCSCAMYQSPLWSVFWHLLMPSVKENKFLNVTSDFYKAWMQYSACRLYHLRWPIKVNLKFTLEQATKAQRGPDVQLYSSFNLGARWEWVVNATTRSLYRREGIGTHCIGGWVGTRAGLDGCGKSHPHRDSIPWPSIP